MPDPPPRRTPKAPGRHDPSPQDLSSSPLDRDAPHGARDEVIHPLRFAGLVAFARCPDPIPSRTRPSTAFAPMVLCLKTWESRSLPGLPNASRITRTPSPPHRSPAHHPGRAPPKDAALGAGWSSPVARQAHNLKAAGSNPAPATKSHKNINAKITQTDPLKSRPAVRVGGRPSPALAGWTGSA